MKNIIIFILFCMVSSTVALGQELSIATRDSIHSDILNEDRYLWVSLPKDYSTKAVYPVLYLLDGKENLYSTYAVANELANEVIPEIIIVAITNKGRKDRQHNMTPYVYQPGDEDPMIKGLYTHTFTTMGGGKKFMKFLEKELIPYIDNKYSTAPYRIIAGHSQSGNFALYAGIVHPDTFQGCIAADPSIWFADGRVIEELKDGSQFSKSKMYVGIANAFDLTPEEIRKDTTFDSWHSRYILRMVDKMDSNDYSGLSFRSKYYEEETHTSCPLITTFDGLKFIFKNYPDQVRELQKIWVSKDPLADITAMEQKYQELEAEFGYRLVKRESEINTICYSFLNNKQMDAAKECFEWNIANYPKSQNVYDSYGDYFLANGDRENAIDQFKRALEIEERSGTRKKLNRLLNGE